MRSTRRTVVLSLISLLAVTAVLISRPANAGPLTGGSGVAPYTKLGVYQGVISIVPDASGNVLEIGNAGQDIAAANSIYIRPGTNAGEANPHDDNLFSKFFRDAAASGKTSLLVPGRVCVGGLDVAHCLTQWPSTAAAGTLDDVLSRGNGSNISIVLGQGAGIKSAAGFIDVSNPPAGKHGISSVVNTAGNAAIYGYNNLGNAGIFEGNVSIDNLTHTAYLCLNGQCIQSWLTGLTCNGCIANYIPKFSNNVTQLVNSQFYDNGVNIGLGTTAPAAKLDIRGNLFVNPAGDTNAAQETLTIGDNDTGINHPGDGQLDLVTNGNITMSLRPDGSGGGLVGIRTTSPTSPLQVGDASNNAFSNGTITAYNGYSGAAAVNTITAHKSALDYISGSAVYGDLQAGLTCGAGQVCAAIYGTSSGGDGPVNREWAGYFDGDVKITGALQLGTSYKKQWTINVCPAGDPNPDHCIGQYLYSAGTTPDTSIITGIKYYAWGAGPAVSGVFAFDASGTVKYEIR